MTHLKSREIDNMSDEARQSRLVELREELLQFAHNKHWVAPPPTWVHTRRHAVRLLVF